MGKRVDFLDLFDVDEELLSTNDRRAITFIRERPVARVFKRGDRVVLRTGEDLTAEPGDFCIPLI